MTIHFILTSKTWFSGLRFFANDGHTSASCWQPKGQMITGCCPNPLKGSFVVLAAEQHLRRWVWSRGSICFAGKIQVVLEPAALKLSKRRRVGFELAPKTSIIPLTLWQMAASLRQPPSCAAFKWLGRGAFREHGADYLVLQKNTPLGQTVIQKAAKKNLGNSPIRLSRRETRP